MIAPAALLSLSLAFSPDAAALTPASNPLDVQPSIGAPPDFQVSTPESFTLSNGVSVWLLHRPALPLVSVRLIVSGGSASDPTDQPGLAALSDTLLTHGAGDRDAVAWAELTERLAINLEAYTYGRDSSVDLDVHAAQLNTGLDLLADAVLRPRFDADEVERVKALRSGEILQELDDPATVARQTAARLYYGPDHPLAHPTLGTTAGVAAASADSARASWSQRFTPARATFVVAGAVDKDALKTALEARFSGWTSTGAAPAPLPPARPVVKGPAGYLVDAPGSAQSVIVVLGPAPRAGDPLLPAANAAAITLGGTFTSRLNALLREKKGYTYGVATRLQPAPETGLLLTRTGVQGEVTGVALADLLAEMAKIKKGVTADELDKARATRRTALVSSMETVAGVADTYAEQAENGLAPGALAAELAALSALDTAQVKKAVKAIPLSGSVVVVVGDLSTVKAQVEAKVKGTWTVVPRE